MMMMMITYELLWTTSSVSDGVGRDSCSPANFFLNIEHLVMIMMMMMIMMIMMIMMMIIIRSGDDDGDEYTGLIMKMIGSLLINTLIFVCKLYPGCISKM